MVKIPILDELKAKLPNLDDLKGMLGTGISNRTCLPKDVKQHMEEVDEKLASFIELQKRLGEAAQELKKEVVEMCRMAIHLYTPKEESKEKVDKKSK